MIYVKTFVIICTFSTEYAHSPQNIYILHPMYLLTESDFYASISDLVLSLSLYMYKAGGGGGGEL